MKLTVLALPDCKDDCRICVPVFDSKLNKYRCVNAEYCRTKKQKEQEEAEKK